MWFELVWGRKGIKVVVFENWVGSSGWGKRERGLVWRSWTVVGIRVWCRWDWLVILSKSRG